MKTIKVKDCSDCPFHKREWDSFQEDCLLGEFSENWGFQLEDDGLPKNCPLRNMEVLVKKS